MRSADRPVVTMVHALPGRVRVRLSGHPEAPEQLVTAVREHEGMLSIEYTPATRSVLVRHDPREIVREEVVLRIATAWAIDMGGLPVRVLAQPERRDFSNLAVLSAALMVSSLLFRLGRKAGASPLLERAAGISTAAAVAEHAWRDVREEGHIHPEVLSLGYLVSAFFRGNFFKASVITWFTTFGRHLLDAPRRGVIVTPVPVKDDDSGEPRYEIRVSPDLDLPERERIVGSVQALLKFAITGGAAHGERNLVDELRDVSRIHGEVVEGLGHGRHGMPIKFQ
jgi:hypothetical protein